MLQIKMTRTTLFLLFKPLHDYHNKMGHNYVHSVKSKIFYKLQSISVNSHSRNLSKVFCRNFYRTGVNTTAVLQRF